MYASAVKNFMTVVKLLGLVALMVSLILYLDDFSAGFEQNPPPTFHKELNFNHAYLLSETLTNTKWDS